MLTATSSRRDRTRSIRARMMTILVVAAVAAVSLGVPVHAAPATQVASTAVPLEGTADAPPVSPPSPTKDGVALQGAWQGPYQLQALHSNACIDMGNATHAGAKAIQWSCQTGRNTQKWWVWVIQGDCCGGYVYLYNAHSGMCLEAWTATKPWQLEQGNCDWNTTEVWAKSGGVSSGYWSYMNYYSGWCVDVGASRKDNGAPIVQWDCLGGANQVFADRQL